MSVSQTRGKSVNEESIVELLKEADDKFDELCEQRIPKFEHWVDEFFSDPDASLYSNLADIAIMCRLQFVKLSVIAALADAEAKKEEKLPIGKTSFKSAGEASGERWTETLDGPM